MIRRYDKTFKHVWYANVGNDGGPNGVPVKKGDTALYIPGPGCEIKMALTMDAYWTEAKQENCKLSRFILPMSGIQEHFLH